MAGHLDTVPANGNERPRVDGDVLYGLGSADMKSGLAVMLRLAEQDAADARFDTTYVFYESEEIADEFNGLRYLFAERPDLVGRRLRRAPRAHRRLVGGRLPGLDAGWRPPSTVSGRTPPGPGRGSTPSTRRPRCWLGWPPTPRPR